jgi:hypothetical protein
MFIKKGFRFFEWFVARLALKFEKVLMCRWFRFAQLAKGKKFRP